MKAVFEVPYDREVAVAVNRGVPVPMSAPRSGVDEGASPRWPRPSCRSAAAAAPATPSRRRSGDESRPGSAKLRSRKAA